MARQDEAQRRRRKEDLGNKMRQCISAPRSWYVFKADVLPWSVPGSEAPLLLLKSHSGKEEW